MVGGDASRKLRSPSWSSSPNHPPPACSLSSQNLIPHSSSMPSQLCTPSSHNSGQKYQNTLHQCTYFSLLSLPSLTATFDIVKACTSPTSFQNLLAISLLCSPARSITTWVNTMKHSRSLSAQAARSKRKPVIITRANTLKPSFVSISTLSLAHRQIYIAFQPKQ